VELLPVYFIIIQATTEGQKRGSHWIPCLESCVRQSQSCGYRTVLVLSCTRLLYEKGLQPGFIPLWVFDAIELLLVYVPASLTESQRVTAKPCHKGFCAQLGVSIYFESLKLRQIDK